LRVIVTSKSTEKALGIVWVRHDLRLADNAAVGSATIALTSTTMDAHRHADSSL